jgi:hypothetical protein
MKLGCPPTSAPTRTVGIGRTKGPGSIDTFLMGILLKKTQGEWLKVKGERLPV